MILTFLFSRLTNPLEYDVHCITPIVNVFLFKVKKIMNSVYHTLRSEFEPGGNYKGADILNTIMNTIKVSVNKCGK